MNWKIKILTALILISNFSCSSLKIENFTIHNEPENTQILTQNFNYQRNLFSKEELAPPLQLIFMDDFNGMPSGSFSFVDSVLFFSTHKGYIFALNANDFKEIGKKKFGQSAPNPPTIYKNYLYQTYDNGDYGLLAYDIANGDEIWEIEENLSSSSAIVVENKVFFQSNTGNLQCLNYLTGENIWETDLSCSGINSIAYNNNVLISTNQDGDIFAIEYSSGVVLWKKNLNDKIFANPVIDKDHLYISTYNGYFYKVNINNGEILQSKKFNFPFYYGPTMDKVNIYIPTSTGKIICINKSEFFENWVFTGSGPAASSVVVSDHYIYFPTLSKKLYILEKSTGEQLQAIELEGRARSIPVIKNEKLFIACEDENVNVFAVSK